MPRPYSQDLRDRVVASVAGDRSRRATAKMFSVSVATVVRWSQRFATTGSAAALDTTIPGGRLVFYLFGALGQFERDLIRERTRAGLATAAARGRKGGRKPVIDAEKLARARSMKGIDCAGGRDPAESR